MKLTVLFCAFIFSLVPYGNDAKSQPFTISKLLLANLNDRGKQSKLYFPKTVKRYYAQNGYQLVWIDKMHEKQTFAAMLLLDCVLQYGLAHADYHPDILSYDGLQEMLNTTETVDAVNKVRFDIFMTDALITLINHLHYGKLNPYLSAKQTDEQNKLKGFDIIARLTAAIDAVDFTSEIQSTQPKSKAYQELQSYMRLVKGQYVGDCYEVPESEVRKVAINMERLRWWENSGKKLSYSKSIYLTCSIKDGLPVFYPDKRHLDQALEAAMYHTKNGLPLKLKVPSRLPKIQLEEN